MSENPETPSLLKSSLSKAAQNYCRLCQLIMTICSDLFRNILSHYISPAKLRGELDKNKKALKGVLRIKEHRELLFPQSVGTIVSAKDMDLTLLYILLRNISGIPTHQKGWGTTPVIGDTSLAACIERIREQKNSIASHSTLGEIDDVRFQEIWTNLQNDIVNIETDLIGTDKYREEVNWLRSCELDESKAMEYAKDIQHIHGIDYFCFIFLSHLVSLKSR